VEIGRFGGWAVDLRSLHLPTDGCVGLVVVVVRFVAVGFVN
jgi:hypothetical protein